MNAFIFIVFYIPILHNFSELTVDEAVSVSVDSSNPTLDEEQALIHFIGSKDPDEAATCGQLIESRGFEYEVHYVITADGYFLQNFIINRYETVYWLSFTSFIRLKKGLIPSRSLVFFKLLTIANLVIEMLNLLVLITFYISIVHQSYGLTDDEADTSSIDSTNPDFAEEQAFLQLFGSKDPDEAATCGELIESRGFEYEVHYVVTADGYILQNFRIINRYARESGKHLKPVLLLHGLTNSCSNWLMNSPVAFLLANLGFDVWLINVRGTSYSTNHTHIDPKDPEFWNFTFYEIAIYDVTATVEHIKKVTRFGKYTSECNKIIIIGHSQGTIQIIVQISVMPGFQENYEVIILAAPVAFLGDVGGFYGAMFNNFVIRYLMGLDNGPSPSSLATTYSAITVFCRNKMALPLCEIQHDRSSNKNLVHLYQSVERDHLSYFDHGKDENINLYGSAEPPEFPYYNIDPEKLVLISALNDNTADQKDVQKFRNSLCDRPCADHIITDPSFNHLDFVQSTQAYKYFGSVLVELIEHCGGSI
uniref:Partial AB-hydrolase lipase domain-containing protein n=1 Tax=Tetranychus urticae TaxID=32264 RepID=T1L5S7_TETUR